MTIKFIDAITGEELGSIVTNRSLTFDEKMEIAGFEWKTYESDGVDSDGWYHDDVLYEEQDIEEVYE